MKLLLIDTCGATGSIALADTEASPAILATATLPGRTASERLVSAIKALAAESQIPLPALGAIAIVHGPGSFTGVRIGLSAAKGLCEALAIPLVAISRLAVLANRAQPTTGRIHALLDAGRGEFYYGLYQGGFGLSELLLTRDEVFAALKAEEDNPVIACEAVVAESLQIHTLQLVPEPTAADALPLALDRIRNGNFDDVATIDANYIRRTDAQLFARPRSKPEVAAP